MDESFSDARMKNPAYPGGFIWRELIEPKGLSVSRAAETLGVTEDELSAFFGERTPLTSRMAERIEKAFGVSPVTLMRMQRSYEFSKDRDHPAP